jgi:hypothetical protein
MRSSLGHPARLSGQEEEVRHVTSAEDSVNNGIVSRRKPVLRRVK